MDHAADGAIAHGFSLLTDLDVHLFREGTHQRLYRHLGAHLARAGDREGTHFAVWAPNASAVAVVGDFNGWSGERHPLAPRWDGSGIWEGFVAGIEAGSLYKFRITAQDGRCFDKADPFGRWTETPPATASRVWKSDYRWRDQAWLREREEHNALDAPWSIYEIHLGSWRRVPEEGNRSLSYRELAQWLPDHVRELGFTHVELMPVSEHPFYGSWGYQCTGYFAPTSRYGTPDDLRFLIDQLHARGIGVILDWVPSHFPGDGHGLVYFDGTHLYEHEDPRQGFHPEWNSHIFNYGRNEVRAFLISNALYWIDEFHIDALRVDAVASMLYLDYGRREGEWIPNRHGGRENLEAIDFLRSMNEAVRRDHPGVQTIAAESTAWPMVSRPASGGGLGFGMKWNMGWMHDTLGYFAQDPIHRRHHHGEITFSIWYAFSENFVLPLSHDEVVYGKGSLIRKMPGDEWQRFANLRLLFGYMWTHPGKKLLFMGGEFAQWNEWNHDSSMDWHLLDSPLHRGVSDWLRDLNQALAREPALHELDFDAGGFEWLDHADAERSILSYVRRDVTGRPALVLLNMTPVLRENHRV
ncbi:MAG TPA: 1,4-alpha-glucan branching protein GlgB, partial [Steroidobacteraceae bacterium]|nr:1,4-alpha-glucan branching protein GlgB [Steroidobacteraceae bacterium]